MKDYSKSVAFNVADLLEAPPIVKQLAPSSAALEAVLQANLGSRPRVLENIHDAAHQLPGIIYTRLGDSFTFKLLLAIREEVADAGKRSAPFSLAWRNSRRFLAKEHYRLLSEAYEQDERISQALQGAFRLRENDLESIFEEDFSAAHAAKLARLFSNGRPKMADVLKQMPEIFFTAHLVPII